MMNDTTGRQIDLSGHLAQSIKNILLTRIGTRLMREEYGSLLPELLDMPLTPAVVLLCHQAIITALARWEPRIRIERIDFDSRQAARGRLKISLQTTIIQSQTPAVFALTV